MFHVDVYAAVARIQTDSAVLRALAGRSSFSCELTSVITEPNILPAWAVLLLGHFTIPTRERPSGQTTPSV